MKSYLILWLSVHNSIHIAGMLKNGFFRSLLPFRILEPLIFLNHEQRTDRLYALDEMPDDLFESKLEGDNKFGRYPRPCSGLICLDMLRKVIIFMSEMTGGKDHNDPSVSITNDLLPKLR